MRAAVTANTRDHGVTEIDTSRAQVAQAVSTVLCARMKELKLTGSALAERSGINRSTISRFENGRVIPTISDIFKLADGLDWDSGYLTQLIEAAVVCDLKAAAE
jgi:predicted transcriptional regulator